MSTPVSRPAGYNFGAHGRTKVDHRSGLCRIRLACALWRSPICLPNVHTFWLSNQRSSTTRLKSRGADKRHVWSPYLTNGVLIQSRQWEFSVRQTDCVPANSWTVEMEIKQGWLRMDGMEHVHREPLECVNGS